ncbi:uncharacterized protein J8A68_004664 [[Candida] subhashii]|uniref:Siderophore iron transporter 1 n=1 Tax=[Candida] subhashii TaxID=561895 RepID=A0A8J5QJX7_9ASCO|nr:uncharacterized protein J8A68_004664 [[Candida] subhashii]KAG7661808.1 hypothetical protein J8A68_004664 [[Candida] subhashii]
MSSKTETLSKGGSPSSQSELEEEPQSGHNTKTTTKSIGIRRAELINLQLDSLFWKICFFFSVFLVSYCYVLDGILRRNLQAYATSSYAQHSLLTTITVIRSVVVGASQPAYARISDRYGRFELALVAVMFYTIGTVVQSQAYTIHRYAGGTVLYSLGVRGILFMLQIILADFSTLNWRLAASFIPSLPHIINTWVSGDIMEQVLTKYSWQWGIGMWAFILPCSCIPLAVCYTIMLIKTMKTPAWKELNEESRSLAKYSKLSTKYWRKLSVELFWDLDLMGMLLLVVVLGCVLVPLTLAGGVSSKWAQGHIIAPLVIGILCIPVFVVWEARFAKFPLMPLALMKDRGIWSALCIAILINWIYYLPNSYMYTVVVVGMNASVKAGTRIANLFTFVSVITGFILGLLVSRVRRLKAFIIFGCACWCAALGILLRFRGDNNGIESEFYLNGVIGGLCLMGFGAGFYTNSLQVSMASVTNHEYMSVILSLYYTNYVVGSSIGSSVSGALWTNKMYPTILEKMELLGVEDAPAMAQLAYGSPFSFIVTYAWGTTERMALVLAYAEVQKYLCIVGLALCFPLLIFAFFLRDHRLDSVQSLEAEEGDEDSKTGMVTVNKYDDDVILEKFKKVFKK